MRDLDGDHVITWPEYWISQAQFTYWNTLLAENATTVPLQTFIDAGVSTELQTLYNQANDSIVTIENYVYVQSIQQLFTILAGSDSIIDGDEMHADNWLINKQEYFDTDGDDQVTQTEW